jgi:hypothetical protein
MWIRSGAIEWCKFERQIMKIDRVMVIMKKIENLGFFFGGLLGGAIGVRGFGRVFGGEFDSM